MSDSFQEFLAKGQVRRRVSTPQYAQSNGAAERAVRTLKTLRAKCNSAFELFQAVLEFQNTPRAPGGQSPADVFLGRSQRTWVVPIPRKNEIPWDTHCQALTRQQTEVLRRQSWVTSQPDTLWPGSRALLWDFSGKSVPVTIVGYGDAPRAYKVQLPSRVVTERNRCFLFPIHLLDSRTRRKQ
jgi:hypothetical protein